MKPFSTPVLSKRTYRELKLLKHLRHENVLSIYTSTSTFSLLIDSQVISLSDIFISPLEDMYEHVLPASQFNTLMRLIDSYFVTELLGTDLHRLLTSRPLEKQFIQYFLYQILVSVGEGWW
jgi:p38 MAP kinase